MLSDNNDNPSIIRIKFRKSFVSSRNIIQFPDKFLFEGSFTSYPNFETKKKDFFNNLPYFFLTTLHS